MWKRRLEGFKKRRKGTVADVLSVGICVLALTVLMLACIGSIQLMNSKSGIDQVARKYILRMETVGYLTESDRTEMEGELVNLGAVDVDFSGSTQSRVDYGAEIVLEIHGKIKGKNVVLGSSLFDASWRTGLYEFEERMVSTAKN